MRWGAREMVSVFTCLPNLKAGVLPPGTQLSSQVQFKNPTTVWLAANSCQYRKPSEKPHLPNPSGQERYPPVSSDCHATSPHTHAHTTYPQENRRGWVMWRIFSPHIKSDNSWVRGGYLKIVGENNPITLPSTMYPGKNGCRLQYKETQPYPVLLPESSALSKMETKMLCEKHQPLQWDVVWHLESCLPLALWDS